MLKLKRQNMKVCSKLGYLILMNDVTREYCIILYYIHVAKDRQVYIEELYYSQVMPGI